MHRKKEDRIITLPNLLSILRLGMIPLFVFLYRGREEYLLAGLVLVLSGVTDVVDGYIARKLDSITNLGKILDPIADKLTQFVVLYVLLDRFQMLIWPLLFLISKEVLNGLFGLFVIRCTGEPYSSEWHGKASTVLLYTLLFLHVVWTEIPDLLSNLLIVASSGLILLSLILYTKRNLHIIQQANHRKGK